MHFTSIALALLGVAATASAAILESRSGFPHCVQKCEGNHFGCNPNDWHCFCRNHDWQGWYQGCCRDNCKDKDFHGAGQAVEHRCRKENNPWGW